MGSGERTSDRHGRKLGLTDLGSRQQGTDRQEEPPFCDAPLLEVQSAAGEAKECRVERWTVCLGVDRGERLLGRGELTLIREGLNEQTGLEDAVRSEGTAP